ncbi:hypothetical protein SGRA_3296 [Saprospira grandis str. Lewin]|uniref:Uncharacterized protein n=1 Tax=Saprospira grandis (strain Lewin) TaxID=984262 RepID=H6L016_SAPGL|nr:hypothetical protein SGRA_3296 [Saprospira grandis str. Lewin]
MLCFCVYIKVVTFIYKRKISLKLLSKNGRRPFGLAMRRGGPQGQTEGETKCSLKGRADLRAPKRSAARRSRSGGPKKIPPIRRC